MDELNCVEIEQVNGGVTGGQLAAGAMLIGIGCLAIAAAPFAFGAAAGIGLATGDGVEVAGGGCLVSVGW